MKLNFGALQRVSGVALVAGLFAGCGGDSSNGVTIAGGPQVKTCSGNQDCNPGQICGSTGTCTDVITGAGGGSGGAGAPPPPGTGTGNVTNIPTGAQGGNSGGVGGGCASANVMFKQETPNVMLVVDRSLSMNDPFGADSRWNTVRTALTDPAAGLLPMLETQVRFGLTMYTSPPPAMGGGGFPFPGGGGRNGGGGAGGMTGTAGAGAAGSSGGMSTECPVLVEVPIALNNYMPIQTVYATTEPLGHTPTGESVAAIWPRIQALDPVTFPGPRVMVLATDGEPNMCGNLDSMAGRRASEMAIQAAYEAGIPTFVISVGDDVGEDHLRRIANIGQGFPANDMMNRFYPANDPSQLADAFETIISGVRACVFDLNGKVNLNAATMGRVTIDGMNLTYMDPNGWHLNGQGQVVVDGSACAQIQQGATGVDIWFPCGAFVPE